MRRMIRKRKIAIIDHLDYTSATTLMIVGAKIYDMPSLLLVQLLLLMSEPVFMTYPHCC